jgi:hypothetical protein
MIIVIASAMATAHPMETSASPADSRAPRLSAFVRASEDTVNEFGGEAGIDVTPNCLDASYLFRTAVTERLPEIKAHQVAEFVLQRDGSERFVYRDSDDFTQFLFTGNKVQYVRWPAREEITEYVFNEATLQILVDIVHHLQPIALPKRTRIQREASVAALAALGALTPTDKEVADEEARIALLREATHIGELELNLLMDIIATQDQRLKAQRTAITALQQQLAAHVLL